MIRNILEIVIYELQAAVATRRALMVIGLYLASGIIGSLVYVGALNQIEEKAIEGFIAQGASAADAVSAISVLEDQAYEGIISFFVGVPKEDLNPVLIDSPILPVFLWASLIFLPLLILMTSFDHVVSDLHNRSICYQLLRVSRREILFGKTIAQMLLFGSVTLVNASVLIVLGMTMLDSIDVAATLPGLALSWALLIPVGFCYLSITTFSSTFAKQPFGALVMTIFILFALKILGALKHWDDMSFMQYFSPSHYDTGLWLVSGPDMFLSIVAYIGFGAFFLFLADRKLAGRDL
ncbi:MAG: ABC transporter permease subunit [Deltaproteobacteria bacterium]|nr:ABC transporter permease subunit [Deltaproteobacteria bacterium]MBT6491906.1 ABC transporter permease subunit [Deltaproteobacteria bacterium]